MHSLQEGGHPRMDFRKMRSAGGQRCGGKEIQVKWKATGDDLGNADVLVSGVRTYAYLGAFGRNRRTCRTLQEGEKKGRSCEPQESFQRIISSTTEWKERVSGERAAGKGETNRRANANGPVSSART